MTRVLHVAPGQVRRSGIADYATAFRHALSGAPDLAIDSVHQVPGIELPPSRDMLLSEARSLAGHVIASGAVTRYDILHLEVGTELYPEFFFAYELARRTSLPLVLTVHDAPYTVKNLQPFVDLARFTPLPLRALRTAVNLTIGRYYEQWMIRHASVALVLSHRASAALTARLHPGRVEVVPHVVLASTAPAARPAWDGSTPLRILFFGFLYPPKGVDHLIAAMAQLALDPSIRSRVRLLVCGGTSNADHRDDYADALRRTVADGELGDIITFAGFIPPEQVAGVISEHHVVVLPYLEAKELSVSGPLIQAMSQGLVPIVTPARAMSEIVQDGATGFVVPVADSASIADRLRQLLDSPALLDRLSHRARRSMADTHGWDAVATRMVEIYARAR